MVTSTEMDELIAERGLPPALKKTEIFAEFFKEYGEHAEWEEWLAFLQERPELEGFEWARHLAG
ncbi:MAG: hypothetical protein GY799_22390 [Desulfobulbaceae bacterium]|nr:hypothetical protein [Desulfobulbaceae bacterium]